MAENNEKKKGGAGKFFLGALLGAVAGAVAGKAVSAKFKKLEDDDFDDECDCGGECEHCKDKDEKIAKLKSEKKEAEKKIEKAAEKAAQPAENTAGSDAPKTEE